MKKKIIEPFIDKCVVKSTAAALFSQKQLYLPRCLLFTLSIDKKLFFAFGRVIKIPSPVVKFFSNSFGSSGLNVHQIFRGASPFVIEQIVETESSRLNSSSPNENGTICGAT
jgi:hypothetical protein